MSDARSITVLDLGLGNLHSVLGALRRVGASPRVGSSAEDIANAERLLVPGQGGFAAGARALTPVRREALRSHLDSGRPYLGICLGMQLLFEGSEEAPGAEGLGYFAGRCVRFDETRAPRIPHMAWTPIDGDHPFVEAGAYFYFVHSYHCVPDDAALTVARADYGGGVCAAVARASVFACQFHPEKSQHRGAALLKRFLEVPLD